MERIDDNTKMPWGKYKGVKMANVPADYLVWLYENRKLYGTVAWYIKENWDVLQEEIKRSNNN